MRKLFLFLSTLFLFLPGLAIQAVINESVTVTALTKGPKHHWFGYYDKYQMDPSGRYVLGMQVDFEHRSPTPEDVITIGMVDLEDRNRWIALGESRAWCWQQGCMLQWRPGSSTEILWNDREDDRFVVRILDIKSKKLRTLPHPIYHVRSDGKYALGLDFSRLQDQRPGYGYWGSEDPFKHLNAPEQSGIYLLDLDTGDRTELISLADIEKARFGDQPAPGKLHFNHIQWNPSGNRFMFLSRMNGNRDTRAYTFDLEKKDLRFLGENSSHFEWRDNEHVLIWASGAYRLYKDDGTGDNKVVLKAANGHNTYLKNQDWIVTDTYPQGDSRVQELYLYHIPSGKKIVLDRFQSPPEYKGEWRCDLHPTLSRDGTKVVIDSTHAGNGRQLYLVDFAKVLEKEQD